MKSNLSNQKILKKLYSLRIEIDSIIKELSTGKISLTGHGDLKKFIQDELIEKGVMEKLNIYAAETIARDKQILLTKHIEKYFPSYEVNLSSLFATLRDKFDYVTPQNNKRELIRVNKEFVKSKTD